MTAPDVVVLDYGSGNLRSVVRAVERAGATVTLTGDFDTALAADGLVVPGVGAYAACMAGLRAIKGERIIGRRLAGGRPVLGICVGHADPVRAAGRARRRDRGLRRVARPRRPGSRPTWCRTWAGTPSRRPRARGCSPASRTSGSTSCTPTPRARWDLVTNDRTTAPLVTWAEHGGDRFVAAVENGPLPRPSSTRRSPGTPAPRCSRNWVASLPAVGLAARDLPRNRVAGGRGGSLASRA